MKSGLVLSVTLLGLAVSAQATVTINLTAGALRDADGTQLNTTNTLWALIQDDGDDLLPGGLDVARSAGVASGGESLTTEDGVAAYNDFSGRVIAVDTLIGGDRVFAVGQGTGGFGDVLSSIADLDLASSNLTAGSTFAFYWFPGLSLAANTVPTTDFEVGGIYEIDQPNGGYGTIIPPDSGSSVSVNIQSQALFGPLDNTRFDAIDAVVPEPSAVLLGLLGGLGLLRRRR